MKIKLSPIVVHETKEAPVISISGLNITIDGQVIDLSIIPEGGEAEVDDTSPFIGKVTREEVTIRYPYSTDLYLSNQPIDPLEYEYNITEGVVPCPLYKKPVEGETKHV